MERRKTLLCTLLLSGALLVGCGEDEAPQEPSTATTDTQPETEPGEVVGTEGSVSTGQAGTTSSITGSDMNVEDETTGDGLSSADQMSLSGMQSEDSQADTAQPESSSPTGGSGGQNSGQPQASSQKNTENEQ